MRVRRNVSPRRPMKKPKFRNCSNCGLSREDLYKLAIRIIILHSDGKYYCVECIPKDKE